MATSPRLVLGLQPVREAIRAHGPSLLRVLVDDRDTPQLDALARFAREQGAKVVRVGRSELDRLAKGGHHQGVLAEAPALRLWALEELMVDERTLLVALDELEDPQNFGAIVRSAVALGATAVLWPENHSAPLTPATFRASAGAVEHAVLCRVQKLPAALEALKERGALVVGLDAQGEDALATVHLGGPTVIVVGAEGKGLRKSVKRVCDHLARLPMSGKLGSLNASVSAALALYEALRQRQSALPSA